MDTIKDFNADSRWNMLSVVWKLQYITRYKALFCKYGRIWVRLRNPGWARKHGSSIKGHPRQRKNPKREGSAPAVELGHRSLASSCPRGASFGRVGTQVLHSPASRRPWEEGQRLLPEQLWHGSARAVTSPPGSPASPSFAGPVPPAARNHLAGTCGDRYQLSLTS